MSHLSIKIQIFPRQSNFFHPFLPLDSLFKINRKRRRHRSTGVKPVINANIERSNVLRNAIPPSMEVQFMGQSPITSQPMMNEIISPDCKRNSLECWLKRNKFSRGIGYTLLQPQIMHGILNDNTITLQQATLMNTSNIGSTSMNHKSIFGKKSNSGFFSKTDCCN